MQTISVQLSCVLEKELNDFFAAGAQRDECSRNHDMCAGYWAHHGYTLAARIAGTPEMCRTFVTGLLDPSSALVSLAGVLQQLQIDFQCSCKHTCS
jgi:hypothetical protein